MIGSPSQSGADALNEAARNLAAFAGYTALLEHDRQQLFETVAAQSQRIGELEDVVRRCVILLKIIFISHSDGLWFVDWRLGSKSWNSLKVYAGER